ncbi:MAG TPA: hypothetical protein VIL20_14795, partial [Sandaracinaceae bacterium]
LRRVARWRPDRYAEIAAEVLVAYGPEDLRPPKGRIGRFGECYLLARVLFGGGDRYEFDTRAMKARYRNAAAAKEPPPDVREEAFPELWDLRPRAYLRVASAGALPEVVEFGARGLARHPEVVAEAGEKTLVGLIASGHPSLVAMAVAELERRFDPAKPRIGLLARLVASEHAPARELGVRLAEASAGAWALDGRALVRLLSACPGAPGAALASAAAGALRRADAAVRMGVATAVLSAIREPEASEGAHAPLAELARLALLAELDATLDTSALLSMIDGGSSAVRSLAGALLGRRPEAFGALGAERVRRLAESEIAAVRRAAHLLLEAAADALRKDPSLLFVLAESAWDDTRKVALDLLRDAVGYERLGLDGLIGLCDASHPDVRALGRELVRASFEELDPQAVLYKLIEHPARDMRRFALELVEEHLLPGFVRLARIEGFARAVLLDLSPDREAKRRLLAFLERRGTSDEEQARVAAGILSEVVRTATVQDFERILAALARIQLAFPSVASSVTLRTEAAR